MDEIAREKNVDAAAIEIWFSDEARIGQKNKMTRRWAKRGTRPSAPHDQRTASTYIFGAICPKEGKGAALILPSCNIEAMTPNERQATLRMLFQSRSGVYHSYVGGTPDMRERMPARGSHPPGAFWYYNNWDFNVLGAVYERKLGKKIGEAFQAEIASPIQMEDFRIGDMYFLRAAEDAEAFARSNFPAYHFRLTARDMARFGYLYLRRGNWSWNQIVPADWVSKSTTSYSETTGFGDGFGYGFLWWVHGYLQGADSFSARGALGKYIIVIPERDLVVAFANHTEFPDGPQAASAAEVKKLPDVPVAVMGRLLALLLAAQNA